MMGSKISNLEPIRNLIKLDRLVINDSLISDISPLEGLVNLRELYLHNTDLDVRLIPSESVNRTISKLLSRGVQGYVNYGGINTEIENLGSIVKQHDVIDKENRINNDEYENEDINSIYNLDELFKRLPISNYVKIFNNNGVYFKDDDIFRLNKTDYYEDGSISYHNNYGKNQLIARFDIGVQSSTEFDNLKDALKEKYGRPFTEDVEEDSYRNAKITRWNGIELRRRSDRVRGETTELWVIIEEGASNNELASNKELSISEIKAYLTSKFASLNTNIGTTKFTFDIIENESSYRPYDYWIQVGYEYEFFEGAMSSNKYSSEQKNSLRRELKEHQKDIGESLIDLLPNEKLYGGYYESWYRYPNLKIDLITRRYFSWTNYDEPDYLLGSDSYDQTRPSYFRWDDLIDDEL